MSFLRFAWKLFVMAGVFELATLLVVNTVLKKKNSGIAMRKTVVPNAKRKPKAQVKLILSLKTKKLFLFRW